MIPMLPHTLSNGICSLNAGEDRLALSCIMKIDPAGRVIDHEIAETVIHVDRRMSYTAVNKILEDQDPEERGRNTGSWFPCLREWENCPISSGNGERKEAPLILIFRRQK